MDRRSPAEEARTLVAQGGLAALSTLSGDGSPWASLVTYAPLDDGTPVLSLSTLAEHGRNLQRDPRASLVIGERDAPGDPLDSGRITLAGRVELAPDALVPPQFERYHGLGDFTTYLLRVERVRWVGGFARMDWVAPADYHAAEPDPVAPGAAAALTHLNADHADALLLMAQRLGGHPDATRAACARIDRYGLDLAVDAPGGAAGVRLAFAAPADAPGDLRAATVELTRRARS